MIAVVLAAGRGSRLGADLPKPLVPVGGVAAVDRILTNLGTDGFDDVVVVTGHRAEEVERHLAGRRVRFVRQEHPHGTADAVLAARDIIGDDAFLVTWSDVLVSVGTYGNVARVGADRDGAALVNYLDDVSTGAAVTIAGGEVTGITEKPPPMAGWNLTGILSLSSGIWEHVATSKPSARGEYELPETVHIWVEAGARLAAVEADGPAFEIGTPEGLAAAEAYWSDDTAAR